jgi:hypothetical protein
MVKLTGKVSINGPMVKSMMANGKMELKRDMVSGRVSMVTHTLVSGRIQKLMDMGYINGRMGIGMKESGRTV